MKILLFTDSRGQHKRGDHQLYWEKLKIKYGDVTCYLCPFKWTTTPDFLALIERGRIIPENYDWIILHTGIVEWSPRPWPSAVQDLYAPIGDKLGNLNNYMLNTRDYSQKVRNYKKGMYDLVFGAAEMKQHFAAENTFDVIYEDQPTINMYSLEMMKKNLIPLLQAIPNLLWISCNPIVDGWRGNYFRERPANIRMIEQYSQEMASALSHVIDLNGWTEEQVKEYTIDNMHLTKEGSDWIYNRIVELIESKI